MKRVPTRCTLLIGCWTLALPLFAQTGAVPAGVVVAAGASRTGPLQPDAGATSWNAGPYSYDPSGNIVGIGGGYGDQTFRYDVNGRLVSSTVTGPLGVTSEQFNYDPYGNMTSHVTDGSSTSYPTDAATNHLTTGINAAYDGAGSLTQWQPPGTVQLYHYTYDAMHMMTESKATDTSNQAYAGAHQILNVYTADDERIWSYDLTAGESHWRLRGLDGKVLRDFDNPGTTWSVWRDYLYRDGALLAAITPTGSEHYTLDHLGTPRFITNGSGNQIGLHTYRPFGQEWTVTDPTQEGNPLRFTGHERDADTIAGGGNGLDYMHARFYEGSVGRFLSVDPGASPTAITGTSSRYSYAIGTPTKFVDPDGRTIAIPAGPHSGTIMSMLTNAITRPDGRSALTQMAAMNFPFTFQDARLNSLSSLISIRNNGLPPGSPGVRMAHTVPLPEGHVEGPWTGAKVEIDTVAVQMLHLDKSGIQTVVHECVHCLDYAGGLAMDEAKVADRNGIAETLGLWAYEQNSDMTREEAYRYLLLLIGYPTAQPLSNFWGNSPLKGFVNDPSFGESVVYYNGAPF